MKLLTLIFPFLFLPRCPICGKRRQLTRQFVNFFSEPRPRTEVQKVCGPCWAKH